MFGVKGEHTDMVRIRDRCDSDAVLSGAPPGHLDRFHSDDRSQTHLTINLKKARGAPFMPAAGPRIGNAICNALDYTWQAQKAVRCQSSQFGLDQKISLQVGVGSRSARSSQDLPGNFSRFFNRDNWQCCNPSSLLVLAMSSNIANGSWSMSAPFPNFGAPCSISASRP
jgi:hypothetical protein